MSNDERTKRGLAVQQRLQENTMMVKPIFRKSRPDAAAILRKFRDGPGEGPGFVSVAVEGKHTPHLLVSERQLRETAERMGGDETAAALHYACELFTPEFRPHGLAHGGQFALSAEGEARLAKYGTNGDAVAYELHRLHPEWDGDEGADDRVVIFGAPDHIYSARERDDGRVVVHNINELQDMKAGRNGERMPLNVTRTLVVRISDEPTEDEQDEAGALDKVARRFSPRRAPPRKD